MTRDQVIPMAALSVKLSKASRGVLLNLWKTTLIPSAVISSTHSTSHVIDKRLPLRYKRREPTSCWTRGCLKRLSERKTDLLHCFLDGEYLINVRSCQPTVGFQGSLSVKRYKGADSGLRIKCNLFFRRLLSAVFDAVGVRITNLPISAERVYTALDREKSFGQWGLNTSNWEAMRSRG